MTKLTKVAQPHEMTLTSEEKRLVVAYRTMDDIGRVKALLSAEDEAEHYPRRAAPARSQAVITQRSIRLAASFGKAVTE